MPKILFEHFYGILVYRNINKNLSTLFLNNYLNIFLQIVKQQCHGLDFGPEKTEIFHSTDKPA